MGNSFSKIKFTEEGGLAVWLTNKTGGASVKGEILEISSTTDDAVMQATANTFFAMGVTYTAGIADGTNMWVVVDGRVEMLADAGGFARADRLITSATAGRALTDNTPSATNHFKEISHALGAAAANSLGLAVIHFL